jgi:hypothetical protein
MPVDDEFIVRRSRWMCLLGESMYMSKSTDDESYVSPTNAPYRWNYVHIETAWRLTQWLTNLIPWNTGLPEKLTSSQLVKKFPAF